MGKLLIFWMICVVAKAMENRNNSKFVRAFDEYELSDPAPHAVRKGYASLRAPKMENPLWANPCDFANGPAKSSSIIFTKELPKLVANQAKAALDEAKKFKDLFARDLQSHDAFSETAEAGPWLRNFKWINADVFPKEKNKIDKEMPPALLSRVTDYIGNQLPVMYKTLKMVAAGLYAIKENGLSQGHSVKEKNLKPYFDVTFNRVRQVLCVFNQDVMLPLKVKMPTLMDNEIPSFKADRIHTIFMIYRDTMLYLDFLRQVMNHWAQVTWRSGD